MGSKIHIGTKIDLCRSDYSELIVARTGVTQIKNTISVRQGGLKLVSSPQLFKKWLQFLTSLSSDEA